MKKIILLLFLTTTGIIGLHSQTTGCNYIQTRTYTNNTASAYLENIQYYDGLGRPVETVQKGITPTKADLVTYQEYDASGREDRSWLPAIASGNKGAYISMAAYVTKAKDTYNNTTYNAAADSVSYSRPVYEASPLNRVVEQYGAGADWKKNSKSVKTAYLSNNGTSGVLSCALFTVTETGVSIKVKRNNSYANNLLYVTRTTDEDGNISYEFKNKQGQTVLTRQMLGGNGLDTYYIYDDFGNLCFVLPPLASGLANGTYDETNATLKNYAYIYKYDSRNRCIWKKSPGCDPVYYIYDKADRLIFTQDGENRKASLWQFSIPDVFGRVVLTGTCKNVFNYAVDTLKASVVKGTFSASRTKLANCYTVSGVTLTSKVILTANFYDNYSFMGITEIPDNTNTQYNAESGYDNRYTASYTGMLTGTATAQMNSDGTISATYLYSIMYYDYRDRLIQTKSNNQLAGGIEKEYTAYNFSCKPTSKKHVHSATGKNTQTEIYTYTYDHAVRLTKETHKRNTGATDTITINIYDELGRLKTNYIGGQITRSNTHSYNIRSWITAINGQFMTENLYYNESYAGSAKCYNGNIGAMSCRVNSMQGYTFTYDSLSRLTAAKFLIGGSVPVDNGTNPAYQTSYTYDTQGNIKTLKRYGKIKASPLTYGLIDNLTLSYTGNQLLKAEDAVANITLAESADFKNYSKETTEYFYNTNGAMTKDLNKGISDIQYNLLNLPRQMDIKSPVAEARNEYTYSASGQKLKTVQKWNPNFSTAPVIGSAITASLLTMNKTTDYVGNMIYENGALKRMLIDGGYIEGGVYHYYVTDHQGNVRAVINASGTIVQKNNYYPFGMAYAETAVAEQGKQPYKFGGKELDQMNGLNQYDYSARYYDPAIARFTTFDPMAEKYYSISPYAYCNNNPVNLIDLTGMGPENPYTYNWTTGNYQDNQGNIVSWNEVQSWLLHFGNAFYDLYKTVKNKLSSQPEALKSDLKTTMDFFTGTGLEERDFGWGTASSESLKNSYMTTVALKKFMEKYRNEPSKQFQLIPINFSPSEKADIGPVESAKNDMGYSTAQFVGSCDYHITIIGDHLNITVRNRTSLWSALYHIPFVGKPSREETPFGIGGNIDETFRFTITLDEARKRISQ